METLTGQITGIFGSWENKFLVLNFLELLGPVSMFGVKGRHDRAHSRQVAETEPSLLAWQPGNGHG